MSLDNVPLIKRQRRVLKRRRDNELPLPSTVSTTALMPPLPDCGSGEVATFTDATDAAAAVAHRSVDSGDCAALRRRDIASSRRRRADVRVSARYDPSIVYAVDEMLTRGAYSVLARWFCSYVQETDAPGCIVVVGYDHGGGGGGTRGGRCLKTTTTNDTVEISPGLEVPRVRINSSLDYPIFELKRCTGFPVVIILLTMHASRLGHDLSCDGRIDIHPRDSMQRSCRRVSDALSHVVERYLTDLFYADKRCGGGSGGYDRSGAAATDDDVVSLASASSSRYDECCDGDAAATGAATADDRALLDDEELASTITTTEGVATRDGGDDHRMSNERNVRVLANLERVERQQRTELCVGGTADDRCCRVPIVDDS